MTKEQTDEKFATFEGQQKGFQKSWIKANMHPNGILELRWEISINQKQLIEYFLKSLFEQQTLAIRLYEISNIEFNGSNANYFYEAIIKHTNNSWRLKNVKKNRNYCVEFGIIINETSFFPIIRSEVINTFEKGIPKQIKKNTMQKMPDWTKSFSSYSLYEGMNGWKKEY